MRPEADQEARLTLLGEADAVYPARVVDLRGQQLRCALEAELRPGALVEVKGPDWLLLGEVERVEGGRPRVVLVRVEHALFDTEELARQRRLWTG